MSIMAALRNHTRSQHERLHQVVDLNAMLADRRSYAASLTRYLQATEPIELGLREFVDVASKLDAADWKSRLTKSDWLRSDLRDLNVEVPLVSLPLFVEDLETFLGRSYVLEGMTLGARQIAPMIQKSLGLDHEFGVRFFSGYAGETGQRWNRFRDWAETLPLDESRTVQHARATFKVYEESLGT